MNIQEMIKQHKAKVFGAIVLAQIVVIAALYAIRLSTLASGVEVKLRTVPVDPRDIVRGQYINLRYDISTIPSYYFDTTNPPEVGSTIYVRLVRGYGDFWDVERVSKDRPTDYGVYLEGRVTDFGSNGILGGLEYSPSRPLIVEYGVEKYFVDESSAKALERSGSLAVVLAIDRSGKAVIKRIEPLEPVIDGEMPLPVEPNGGPATQPATGGVVPTPGVSKPLTPIQREIRARDDERIAELKQLRVALKAYAADHAGKYPSSLSLLAPTYLVSVPTDPTTHTWYNYESKTNLGNTTYTLWGWLEDATNPALASDAIPGDLKYDVQP